MPECVFTTAVLRSSPPWENPQKPRRENRKTKATPAGGQGAIVQRPRPHRTSTSLPSTPFCFLLPRVESPSPRAKDFCPLEITYFSPPGEDLGKFCPLEITCVFRPQRGPGKFAPREDFRSPCGPGKFCPQENTPLSATRARDPIKFCHQKKNPEDKGPGNVSLYVYLYIYLALYML